MAEADSEVSSEAGQFKLSPYAVELVKSLPDVGKRYLMKIRTVSVDPFLIEEKECTRDFPDISPHDIVTYLLLTHSFYTQQQYKAYKSLDAYKYFEAGFVNLIGTQIVQNQTILLGKVKHSQRMREKPVSVWVLCKLDGDIQTAHCTCMAGLGEVCSHIAAVLYATEFVKRHETSSQFSVTDQSCSWSAPSVSGNIPVVPIKEMNWGRGAKARNRHDPASSSDVQLLLQSIHDQGLTSAAMRVFEPFATDLRTDQILQLKSCLEIYDRSYEGLTYEELLKIASHIKLSLSDDECIAIDVATMEQSLSYEWYRHRAGRITASNFKRATRTNIDNPSISLLKTICYPIKMAFKSKYTAWGIKHEKDALRQFTDEIRSTKRNLSIEHAGLVVNSSYPQLGASPDALLYSDDGKEVVEIKCPFLLKNMTLAEFSQKKGTCLICKDNSIKLDRDHSYYYQLQMQLKLTNAARGYFVMWSPQENLFIEEIMPDEPFWSEQVKIALEFHSKIVMPELLGRFFTNKHGSLMEEWCHCKQSFKNGYMIKCGNEQCKIVWFHEECVMPSGAAEIWICDTCK